MKFTLNILFTICIFLSVFSQKNTYGKILPEELEQKQSDIKSEAPAEIIYKEVKLSVNVYGELEMQVFERIKVYDKDKADEFLTYEVPLHKNGNELEKISGFKASTYNLENGKVVEMKIKNNQTITEEKHKYLNLFKFTFSDVRDGSVLEYKYTFYSPWISEIPIQYFDYKIPLRSMKYTCKIPYIYFYIPDIRGLNSDKLKINNDKSQIAGEYPFSIFTLSIDNVKPYEEEPYVMNYKNIRTSVRYELSRVDIPGKTSKNFSTTWNEVGKTLLQSDNFSNYYSNTHQFKDIIPSLITNLKTTREKATAILKYVQENFVWNEYVGVHADQSLSKTIKTKSGNSGDLNLLVIAMLREAGINANPVVLSTVSNGMLNYTFPSLQKLNYVIAAYYDNGELNLLDATNKYSEINQLPKRALNYRGFYIDKDNIKEVDLTNRTISTDNTLLTYSIKPDLEFVGNMTNSSGQYFGMTKMEEYKENKEKFDKKYRSKYTFPLENLEFSNNSSIFKTSFSFNSVTDIEKIGDKLVFNPLLFTAEKEQVFKAENRTYPIELGSPSKFSKIVIVTLPEGYKVDKLPTSKKYKMIGNLGSYEYIIKNSNNQIEIKTTFLMNEFFISANYYSVLKEFWELMIETENQLVSLIKE